MAGQGRARRTTTDPVGHLAVLHNHPQWIVRAFAEALGGDLDDTARLLIEDNEPAAGAPVRPAGPGRRGRAGRRGRRGAGRVLAVRGLPARRRARRPGRGRATAAPTCRTRAPSWSPRRSPTAPVDGPGRALARPVRRSRRQGRRCSARSPPPRGAEVTAVEVAEHRARLVEQATAGLPVDACCRRTAATVGPRPGPARGRLRPGAGRRAVHRAGLAAPAARSRAGAASPSDLPPLTRLQRELLGRGAAGGPAGRGGRVRDLLAAHGRDPGDGDRGAPAAAASTVDFVDARPLLPPGMPGLGAGPTVQLWPHRHGTDAMFLAVLRRTGAEPDTRGQPDRGRTSACRRPVTDVVQGCGRCATGST